MPGLIHIVVFSNFEGWSQPQTAATTVQWFTACSQAHPQVKWTHLYNPYHLIMKRPEVAATECIFSPYLLSLQNSGMAEIGLHIHMFYDLIGAIGVEPIGAPFASDQSENCDSPRNPQDDLGPGQQGYDVLMTGYAEADRASILDVSIGAFLCRGFDRPKTYCAAYVAIDPSFQALLAAKGFTTSMSTQAVPPSEVGKCWGRQVAGRITPLTIPYKVNRQSILPPPHDDPDYLDLVELPLNMGVDAYDIFLDNEVVSREDMFDLQYDWARDNDSEMMVAIGVHADAIQNEAWPSGGIARSIDHFLKHVALRAQEGGNIVQYGTASEVSAHFQTNTSIGYSPNV